MKKNYDYDPMVPLAIFCAIVLFTFFCVYDAIDTMAKKIYKGVKPIAKKIWRFIKISKKPVLLILFIVTVPVAIYFVVIPGSIILGVIMIFIVWLISIAFIIGYIIFWILKKVLERVQYSFVPEKEKIEGEVILLFKIVNSQPQPLAVTEYFLRIKNSTQQKYTVMIPESFFDEIKMQIEEKNYNFSFICKKNKWEDIWNLP